jgi:hypothetical protein
VRTSIRRFRLVLAVALAAWSLSAASAGGTPAIQVTITSGPSGTVNSAGATFTFSANEPGVTFECSLDGAARSPCTSPQGYTGLTEADHTFIVFATDRDRSNVSSDSRTWTARAPDTSITAGPSGATTSTAGRVIFESDVRTATFECSLDGGAFAGCASGVNLVNLGLGQHIFRVRAVAGGLTDASPAQISWNVVRLSFPLVPPRGSNGPVPRRLPVYDVTGTGFSAPQADALARALGIPARGLRLADRSLRFLDDQRFERLPSIVVDPQAPSDEDGGRTVVERADFAAIKRLKPLAGTVLRPRVVGALRRVGLPVPALPPQVENSSFVARALDGTRLASSKVDTSLDFPFRLSGFPLDGPGAQEELTFDPAGKLTRLDLAGRTLARGATFALIPPRVAARRIESRLEGGCDGSVSVQRLSRRVTYFAPPLALRAKRIVPYYEFSGTALVNGVPVVLKRMLLPAVDALRPRVSISARDTGGRVSATAQVRGGTPPYTYRWSSCATPLTQAQASSGRSTSYPLGGGATGDTVALVVRDANGVTGVARARVRGRAAGAAAFAPPPARAATGGVRDVATEYIGASQGLLEAAESVDQFRDEMSDVAGLLANRGDDSVLESDFMDPLLGGQDSSFADGADLTYYDGHGSPDGFTVSKNSGNGFVDYTQTKWGNGDFGFGDMEWIALGACQVLADANGSKLNLDQRWISHAFKGLHMMLSYVTNSSDVPDEGNEFGDDIADDDMRIRSAWVDAAESEQPDGVVYRYMGVFGPGGTWNYNDYFHGIGPVTKDITKLTGYWYYTGVV